MRIGFAGTPAFAAVALEAILDAGLPVTLVLSRPDRPRGRGLKLDPGPVKAVAAARGIPVFQPVSLTDEAARTRLTATALDVLVVAAYGLILPKAILDWPRHGCINIHASLLPRWRGAAPIQRALLAGDGETGISIMRMDEGLDTGPIIARHRVPISARETAGSLHDRLAVVGAQAIVATLAQLRREAPLRAEPQPEAGVTYAAKIARAEASIDWDQSAQAIDRRIRAFNPTPGAQTTFAGETVKIWDATPLPAGSGAPGWVTRADAAGIVVACGEGTLVVTTLQRAGGRRLSAAAFLAGHRLATGTRLGGADS
jgi:methionyl-tRNA formyltransferase